MSKPEKYWVYCMIFMLSANNVGAPTLISSINSVVCFISGSVFFILMLWCIIRGEK